MWTVERELAAATVDRLGDLIWVTGAVNAPKGKNPIPEPTPVPRPGDRAHRSSRPVRRHATIDEMRRFFGVPKQQLPRTTEGGD